MTDIVGKLRQNNELEWDYTMELQEEAAAEIERLQTFSAALFQHGFELTKRVKELRAEIARLRVEAGYDLPPRELG